MGARIPNQLIPEPLLRPAYRLYEARLLQKIDPARYPRHVAVILDGHRRYAREEGLSDYATSYRAGMNKFLEFLGWSGDLRIPAITAWVLSTDNLRRPRQELEPYFEELIGMFERLPRRAGELGYRVRFIGSLDLLPERLVTAAKTVEEKTRAAGDRRLTVALGYGGRQEIVDACRDLIAGLAEQGIAPSDMASQITAEAIEANLYTADLPDPDLVIRTSGEARLSGFLLWQSAFAEYVFADVYWPCFRRVDFLRAIRDYSLRQRRFGA